MKNTYSIFHNVTANFIARAWIIIANLIFIPIFIKITGVEAYGLIGIFTSLTALLAVLDLGLSSLLSRELSRLSVIPNSEHESRDLVKTLEMIYWSIGLLIGIGVILLAPFIARQWINSQGIDIPTVQTAVMLMGLSLAFQWPSSLYSGGLMGLQRQILLNAVRIITVTLQYGGALLILWLISPTILPFFMWEAFIGAANTLLLAACIWKTLPGKSIKPQFNSSLLRKNWRFATGMTGIVALVTILTQLDKVILSKMLSLEFFGYYAIAFSGASVITHAVTPIFSVLFPEFSQIVATDNKIHLTDLYHKWCQMVAIVILPAAIILAVFSEQILSLWLSNPATVQNTNLLLTLLAIGTSINAIVTLPYTLQLAYGWTKLSVFKNIIAILLLTPLMILLVKYHGATGAALAWIILNLGYLVIEVPIMHRRLLKGELWSWYLYDVAIPLIIAVPIVLLAKLLMPDTPSRFLNAAWIFMSGILTIAIAAYAMKIINNKRYCSKKNEKI